jgi:hypothetical protein
MYVYLTSKIGNVHIEHAQKVVVEPLMVEHFGVHRKAHKPSPTLGRQWNNNIILTKCHTSQ